MRRPRTYPAIVTQPDPGHFGPDSITWTVNQEITVLFGGARALLMHAAHPLVSAGARQTALYSRDPWARLIRTLQLQNLVTFGTKQEAAEAAHRINKLHEVINGTDEVTGKHYDALDPELLLWVHAALEVSSVWFFEKTVRPLTPAERQQYHEESMIAAELVWLERKDMPATFDATVAYVESVLDSGELVMTDVAGDVADLIRTGPVPWQLKPIWAFISFAAFGTLPDSLKEFYGVKWGPFRQRWLDLNLWFLGRVRPLLPRRYRLIGPARWAYERLDGNPDLRLMERAKAGR